MSATAREQGLDSALEGIAAGADALDRSPRFPNEAFEALHRAGATSPSEPIATGGLIAERWALVRSVAAADSSVGRVLDGHLNAIERIALLAPAEPRDRLLDRVREGAIAGVWGADPPAGEADPAAVAGPGERPWLRGAKDFCSGAGGVEIALVLARSASGGPPLLALVEADGSMHVDRTVFRAAAMRASESHRVHFDDTPVAALLGEPGEIASDPWFSGDAMRTAASWAGMADAVAAAALADLATRRASEPLSQLAAGRIAGHAESLDAWLAHGARRLADRAGDLRATSIAVRTGVAASARAIVAEAERACGSTAFVGGGRLERARRDLELFLLQHRLDPLVERVGADLLQREPG